jgi:ribonuclease R
MIEPDDELTTNGVVSVHPRGFGFLNFELGGQPASAFIAPPDLNPFLSGDRVSARVEKRQDGRYTARELNLEGRSRAVLFGQVRRRKGRLWLDIDEEVANTDWPLLGQAEVGDYVLAQVESAGARVAEVLPADADISLERLIARYDLVEEFDDECYEEVEQVLLVPHSLGQRRDLRAVRTITIDAPTTTDLDDAVSVLPGDSEGAVRLLVSIADPAAFISVGSALDEEARARGTSTYLIDRVLPMLPHRLSSGHLSLQAGQERCCLTVEMRIDIEGEIRSVDLYESLIRSNARVSYDELSDWLKSGRMSDCLLEMKEMLPWLRTASARLSLARLRRGGVMVSDKAARVTLDEDRKVVGTRPTGPDRAHLMVERFMVAANEAVARWLCERGFPGLYRVHPEPEQEKVEQLASSARQFGFEPGFTGRLTPLALAGFDIQIRGVRSELAVRSVLRGVLEKARYSPEPGLHLGLGAPLYLHFTSPLRRYADFAVHRLIKAYLAGERSLHPEAPEYFDLCEHLNHRALLAGKAEALRRRMLLAQHMEKYLGEVFEGRITRVLPFGLVVQLEESLVEGLLPLESLSKGPWTVTDTAATSDEKSLLLGEAVSVELVKAEPELGELEFALR